MGGGGPGHVSVAQVRVPDATGLSKGSQRGVQSYVVIKPHDQHQMQVNHLLWDTVQVSGRLSDSTYLCRILVVFILYHMQRNHYGRNSKAVCSHNLACVPAITLKVHDTAHSVAE